MKLTHTTIGETAKSIIRISLISIAAAVGTICLMGEPPENSPTWLSDFIFIKALAAAGWYVAWLLYTKWSKIDKWLAKYDKRCEEALNAPNPMCLGEEDEQK